MRRIIGIAMFVLMILCVLTGIAELRPSHTGAPVHHIVISVLFIIAACTHAWLNRKALVKHLFGSKKD